jgi:probable HAF family extracellular repeat protein
LGFILSAQSAAAGGAEATFESLGNLRPSGEPGPGATFASEATGVSADGMVVAGFAASENSPSFDNEAFRWTASGGMTALGFLGSSSGATASFANGISGDGLVVVGNATSNVGAQAFRWTQSGGIVGLGVLNPGDQSVALGASAKGAVVVGESGVAFGNSDAFRWTQASGMVGLGDFDGGATLSRAEAVSADGSVVVGHGTTADGEEAFHWTSSGGMVGLGDLPGGDTESKAHGVSNDGAVVVGESQSSGDSDGGDDASSREAFMWTDADGITGLGDFEGGEFDSTANAASAHGVVIVGRGTADDGDTAFRYTDADGMRSIQEILVDDFAIDLTDWKLAEANGVSGDGRTIVGLAFNPDGVKVGFVATIPLPDGVSEEALSNVNDGGSSSNGGNDSGNGGSNNGGGGDSGGNGGGDSGGNGSGGNGGSSMPTGCGVATATSIMFITLGLCGFKGNRRRVGHVAG